MRLEGWTPWSPFSTVGHAPRSSGLAIRLAEAESEVSIFMGGLRLHNSLCRMGDAYHRIASIVAATAPA